MSLCVFLWFQVFSGWNWGTWAEIRFRGWRRTADAVGFWPPCTQSGFSGATELKMACFQLRWKVDIQGFPAILIVHILAEFRWRKRALNASSTLLSGVKRQKHVTSQSWTPEIRYKLAFNSKIDLYTCNIQAQPKHTPSGPRKWIYTSITYFCKP